MERWRKDSLNVLAPYHIPATAHEYMAITLFHALHFDFNNSFNLRLVVIDDPTRKYITL